MKVFLVYIVGVVFCVLWIVCFQNQSRTLSIDTNGHRLSFDLGLWGVGY